MLHCCVVSIQYNQLLPLLISEENKSDVPNVDHINDLNNLVINKDNKCKDINKDSHKDSNNDIDISSNMTEEIVINRNRRGSTLIVHNAVQQTKGNIMSSILQKTSLLGNAIFSMPIAKVFNNSTSSSADNIIIDKSSLNYNGENIDSEIALEKLKFVPSKVLFPLEISRLNKPFNILDTDLIERKIDVMDKKNLLILPSFLKAPLKVIDLGEVKNDDLQVYIHLTTLPLISNFNRIFEGSKDIFALYDEMEESVQFSSDVTNISNICPLG